MEPDDEYPDPGHLLPQEAWDAVEKEAARIREQEDEDAGRQSISDVRLRGS